jgi:integrase
MNPVRRGLKEYLAVRRALGYELRLATGALHNFVDFLEQRDAVHITTQLALAWAKQPKGAQRATWSTRLSMVRCFARHYAATDPLTEVPPDRLLACRIPRRNPYIYTDGEVGRLLAAARKLPSTIGLRPWTYSTLFGLIAVTGMRISEPLGLDGDDVDLDSGMITIRKTKFRKSRLVPVHTSTKRVLRAYARRRDQIFPRASCPSFFLSDRGTPLTQSTVRWTFVKLSCKIGLREPAKSHGNGPRLQDFRHRVAVRTLLEWYKSDVDVEQNLPKLSTFLGHAKVTDTYWYLSATPELLQLAADRLQPTKERLL